MYKKIVVLVVAFLALLFFSYGIIKFGWFLPEGGVAKLLTTGDMSVLMPFLVIFSALVDSFNPCAFSVLLITIAFLFSLERSRKFVAAAGSVYILGIFLTYLFIGLGLIEVLNIFGVPHFMARIGAAIVIIWAVFDLLGEFFPRFPIKLAIPAEAKKPIAKIMSRGTIPAAFVVGALVGLTEFPCTGGPYLFILGLLHDRGAAGWGLAYLILYNLIFVFPLFVILTIASDRNLLSRVDAWRKTNNHGFRIIMGVTMLLLGVAILQF